jgi:uncharacterized protein (TIGR03086 family)
MDLPTLERACAATEPVVAKVTPAHYGLSTPCTEWDVHDLLNHLVGTLAVGRALLRDEPPTVAMGPGQLPPTDLVGDDPAAAYGREADALLGAVDAGDFERIHATPLGEMPGAALGGFVVLDIVVHGWDLGRAIDVAPVIDDDLAGRLLGFAHASFAAMPRAPVLGPEVSVPPDASATDRLVAYTGRTP